MDTEQKEFAKYIAEERGSFAHFINSYEWRTDLRTAIESLLIAYDQMVAKLTSQFNQSLPLTKEEVESIWDAAVEYEYASNYGRVPTDKPNKTEFLSSFLPKKP